MTTQAVTADGPQHPAAPTAIEIESDSPQAASHAPPQPIALPLRSATPIPAPPDGFQLSLADDPARFANLSSLEPFRLAVINLIAHTRPKRFIEVGCHLGSTSLAVLDAFPACNVLGVDWFRQAPVDSCYWASGDYWAKVSNEYQLRVKHVARAAMRKFYLRGVILNETSRRVVRHQPEDSADAVFLDAAYDWNSITTFLNEWWPKVRRGGMLLGRERDIAFLPADTKRRAVELAKRGTPEPTAAFEAVSAWCREVDQRTAPRSEWRNVSWHYADDGNVFYVLAKGGKVRPESRMENNARWYKRKY